ncbi:hypothetical protein SBA4_880029 [Candidatus Sulfopaludibacter sp. SbA4]|nr:hypothetical protein SBA4_880029 [Candidatus Sulfopaludibacter sp. SbA4]
MPTPSSCSSRLFTCGRDAAHRGYAFLAAIDYTTKQQIFGVFLSGFQEASAELVKKYWATDEHG